MKKHPQTAKARIQHRIKIISGHLRKLESMVEHGDYCVDIMTQSLAIQKSLESLNKLILENHLTTCVADQFKTGQSAKAVSELTHLYHLKNRS